MDFYAMRQKIDSCLSHVSYHLVESSRQFTTYYKGFDPKWQEKYDKNNENVGLNPPLPAFYISITLSFIHLCIYFSSSFLMSFLKRCLMVFLRPTISEGW